MAKCAPGGMTGSLIISRNLTRQITPLNIPVCNEVLLPFATLAFYILLPFDGFRYQLKAFVIDELMAIIPGSKTIGILFGAVLPKPGAQIAGHTCIKRGVVLIGKNVDPCGG
jgi:hypothetical protein